MRSVRLLVVSALLATSACGGSATYLADEVVFDDDVLVGVATRTLDGGTARMALEVEVTGDVRDDAGMGAFSIEAEGMLDLDSGEGGFTLDMSSVREMMTDEEVELYGDDLTMEIRVLDGYLYMSGGPLLAEFGSPTDWLSIDMNEALDDFGYDADAIEGLENQAGFTDYVEMLSAASGGVDMVGRERVRGTETTHFRATLDLEQLAREGFEDLPDEIRERLEAEGDVEDAFGQLSELFAGVRVPTDAWIDDDGRLRKQVMRLDMEEMFTGIAGVEGEPVPADVEGLEMVITIEFYDYGVDLELVAPPERDTTDLLALLDGRTRLD